MCYQVRITHLIQHHGRKEALLCMEHFSKPSIEAATQQTILPRLDPVWYHFLIWDSSYLKLYGTCSQCRGCPDCAQYDTEYNNIYGNHGKSPYSYRDWDLPSWSIRPALQRGKSLNKHRHAGTITAA